MEKYLFIDKDDVMINSSPLIQKYVQLKTSYKQEKLNALEYRLALARYNYSTVKSIISKALEKGRKPILPVKVRAGSNDVIRRNDGSVKNTLQTTFERWYFEPLELASMEEKEALLNKEMFLEERDNFLEMDNLLDSDHIVDYDSIYVPENANTDVVNVVKDLANNGEFTRVYELSHYNGPREYQAKKRLNQQLYGEDVPFLGLRFHLNKHADGIRRERSSKAEYIQKLFNLPDLSNCYFIDDSKENIIDCVKYGAKAIIYKPLTNEEIENNVYDKNVSGSHRLFNFTEEEVLDAVYDLDHRKKLVKVKK